MLEARHDLTETSTAMRDDLGYAVYCFHCATFFRDVDDAELTECRPVDTGQHD